MREEPHSNDCIDIASYEQCGINKEKNEHNNSNDNINKKNPYKQRYEKKRKEKESKATERTKEKRLLMKTNVTMQKIQGSLLNFLLVRC